MVCSFFTERAGNFRVLCIIWLLSDKCSVREIPWKDKIKDKSKVSLISFFFSCICIRHQNGRKVMSVRDVVVLSSGISRLCGIRKQWV